MSADDFDAPDHPLRAQAEADMARLLAAITELTQLETRWRGIIAVRGPEFTFAGQKHRWSGISLREDILAVAEYRWPTMIHEGLHSVSGAFSTSRMDPANQRWEEASAEQTHRLLRLDVLSLLGLELDPEAMLARDASHLFNRDIRTLESLRVGLAREARPFYLELLAATVRERARIISEGWRTVSTRLGEER